MKEKTIEIKMQVCQPEELSEADRQLIEAAKNMTYKSYAPYSGFHVGAAIRMDDGSIECGANQENAAFSSGTCAERSACFHAGANHPGMPMRKIAIAARNVGAFKGGNKDEAPFQSQPIPPCGACRQALLEYENIYGPMEVFLYGTDETYVLPSVASLMPLSFTEF